MTRWQEWEEKFAGYISGHVQKRSGGLWYARMDVVGKKFLWSLKDTIGNSFSIKNSDLDEVAFNARKQGAIPGMAVRVNDEEYAIIKIDDLIALLEEDTAIISKEKNKLKREVVRRPPLLRD